LQAGTRKIEVELTTVSSNHHVELNPSDAGFQDRYVVQEIIKEMAKNRPLDVAGNRGFKGTVLSTRYIATQGSFVRFVACISGSSYRKNHFLSRDGIR